MLSRPYLLSFLLLLLPLIAVIDGLAMAPMAVVLFLLLAWRNRGALKDWRSIYKSSPAGIAVFLLLTVWPLLSPLWSILPRVSLATASRDAVLLALAPLSVFLSRRQDGKTGAALWAWPALGIVLAALFVISAELPGKGLAGLAAKALKMNQDDYLNAGIHRGLCVLAVLVWPAVIGLWRNGRRRLAMVLPWALLPAIFSQHSLSAKVGLTGGMLVFYARMRWPRALRRFLLWAVPLAFMAWPLLFHLGESTLRQTVYADLPNSSQHRIEIWHFAYGKWQERPWLGWGVDSSRAIPGGLKEFKPGLVYLPLHPHNLGFNVLLEEGLVGFGLFTLALALFVRSALPGNPPYPVAIMAARAAAFISYLLIGMSGFGMWQGWWVATGIAAFLMTVFAEEETKTPASLSGKRGSRL